MHVRPGATGGKHIGAVPPQMTACAPKQKLLSPKQELCPEEISRLGAAGVQIEAQIGVCHWYFCKFCGLKQNFMTLLDLFFLDHLFSAGETA